MKYIILLLKMIEELKKNHPDEKTSFFNDLIQKLQSELSEFTEEEKQFLDKLKPLIEKIQIFYDIQVQVDALGIPEIRVKIGKCIKLNNILYQLTIRSWYVLHRKFYHNLRSDRGGAKGFMSTILKKDISDFISFMNLTSSFFSPFLGIRQQSKYDFFYGKYTRSNLNLSDINDDIKENQSYILKKIQNFSLENIEKIMTQIQYLSQCINELDTLKKEVDDIYFSLCNYEKEFKIIDDYLKENAILIKEMDEMDEMTKKSRIINYECLFKEAVRRISYLFTHNPDIKERFSQSILRWV